MSSPGAGRRRRPRVVVTAGPTREHVDPVRYLSNESSGRMGFAIARAAARAGCRVTLISGPVHQKTPPGVRRIDVVSAREMLAAVRAEFSEADALYMCAAVADWRPARRLSSWWDFLAAVRWRCWLPRGVRMWRASAPSRETWIT